MLHSAQKTAAQVSGRTPQRSLFGSFGPIIETVQSNYGAMPSYKKPLVREVLKQLRIERLQPEEMENFRILDLGCGSRRRNNVRDEPFICRCLVEMGFQPKNVVGIDILPQLNEPFTSYALDLLVPGSMDFLSASSFNRVIATWFIHLTGDMATVGSPEIAFDVSYDHEKAVGEIRRQVNRILAEGGLFVTNDESGTSFIAFKKTGRVLETIK